MQFSYKQGTYEEGRKKLEGEIILSEHKLFLKGPEGDLTETYIPLEKIEAVRKTGEGVAVQVRPSITIRYVALINGGKKQMDELVRDIVQRRGLKKRFLKNEWVEQPH